MRKNEESFLRYYNQFKDKIYNYFLYRVGFDKSLAEDLSSEVFIKALKNFEVFDENQKFQSWIYMIAHNHLVNHYKVSNRVMPLDSAENLLLSHKNEGEMRYEVSRVLKVIGLMEETDREILRLRFVDELSNQEIADVLEKEEGAIRTQLSRSLNKLRKILEDNQEK